MDKISKLREERRKLEERIRRIEGELKKPLTNDMEEDAMDEDRREVLYGLYQVEKENLNRLDAEIYEESVGI